MVPRDGSDLPNPVLVAVYDPARGNVPVRAAATHSCREQAACQQRKLPRKDVGALPDILIVCNETKWPHNHPVIQHARELGRLVYASRNRGIRRQTVRAVASLSKEDGARVRNVIQHYRKQLAAKQKQRREADAEQ